jgi:hypothetical protein
LVQTIARRTSLPFFQVQRARILLGVAEGESLESVAERFQCGRRTVWRICRCYLQAGLPGLLATGAYWTLKVLRSPQLVRLNSPGEWMIAVNTQVGNRRYDNSLAPGNPIEHTTPPSSPRYSTESIFTASFTLMSAPYRRTACTSGGVA